MTPAGQPSKGVNGKKKSWSSLHAFALFIAVIVGVRLFNYLTICDLPYLQYRTADENYFHNWATDISHGHLIRGAAFFTSPLYAYVLGLYYSVVGDSLNGVIALNMCLGIAAVILLALTAKRLGGPIAGCISLLLAGLCAAPVFYESFAEKTSLVLFLTALAIYLATRAFDSRRKQHWAMAGAAAGLASLAHPLLMVLAPAILSYALITGRGQGTKLLKELAVFAAAGLLVILPAAIHNYVASRDFVLICSNGGQNFYVGNHAGNLTGLYTSPAFSYAALQSEELGFKKEAERRNQRAMRPSEMSSYWFKQGLSEAASLPGLSAQRFVRKIRWALGNEEITDTRNMQFYRQKLAVFMFPLWGFGLVSFLGLISTLLLRDRKFLPCILFAALYTVGTSLFFVYGRYRMPLLVPFSILAGCGVAHAGQAIRQWNKRFAVIFVAIAVLVCWVVYAKALPGTSESFFTDYYNMGNKYFREAKYDAAAAEYEKALWENPGDHPARKMVIKGLAELYQRMGNITAAQRLLERAIAAYPDDAEFRDRRAALRQGQASP